MQQLSLTRFELYKLFSRKSVWIFLGAMLFVLYLPLQILTATSAHPPYYQPIPPTTQQVQQAKAELSAVSARMQSVPPGSGAYWTAFREQQRDETIAYSTFQSVVQPNIDQLQQKISQLRKSGNTGFQYRMSTLEYNLLKGLPYIGAGQYFGAGSQIIDFFKTYGFVIFGTMILIGLSPVFSEEYAIGTDSFLLSTKRGKRELVTAKLFAATVYVLVLGCIMTLVNVVSNVILYKPTGFSYPLQSIALYTAPFHFSIWQYIAVATAIQLLGGVAFSFVVLFISSLSRISLVSFFLSAGIFVLPEFILRLTAKPWAEALMNFSYTGLIQVSRLFYSFIVYNLFGYPVLYPVLIIGLAVLISLPIVRLIYVVYSRHEVA